MDPDAALARMKELIKSLELMIEGWVPGVDLDYDVVIAEEVSELRGVAEDLAQWEAKGGFAPSAS